MKKGKNMVEQESQEDLMITDEENPKESSYKNNINLNSKKTFLIAGIIVIVFIFIAGFLSLTFLNKKSTPSTPTIIGTKSVVTPQPLPTQVKKSKATTRKKRIKYVSLYTLLDGVQSTAIIRELSLADIAFEVDQKGKNYNLLVDKDKLADAQTLLAMKGLPSDKATGYEIFDNAQNLGVTEFDKRIRYIRAISGELENSIREFDSIEICKVQVVLPEEKLFSVTQPPVTASILVRKAAGYTITDETVYAIIQLVTNAVENLQAENISVVDTEGNVLSIGIFERIAQKQQSVVAAPKTVVVEEETEPKEEEIVEEIIVVVPEVPSMSYLEIKVNQEKNLEAKAVKQLFGILPSNSYKVSVVLELQDIVENLPKVKRMAISIVVDKNTVLTSKLKTKIFNTIAGSTGYIKGRDIIKLTKANFALTEPVISPEAQITANSVVSEEEPLEKDLGSKQSGLLNKILSKITLFNTTAIFGGLVFIFFVLKIFRRKKNQPKPLVSSPVLEKQQKETDFSGL
ncbi:hypothetical protein HN511_05395, partial [bacterium]|nr:hypothetical protein [bacterium]